MVPRDALARAGAGHRLRKGPRAGPHWAAPLTVFLGTRQWAQQLNNETQLNNHPVFIPLTPHCPDTSFPPNPVAPRQPSSTSPTAMCPGAPARPPLTTRCHDRHHPFAAATCATLWAMHPVMRHARATSPPAGTQAPPFAVPLWQVPPWQHERTLGDLAEVRTRGGGRHFQSFTRVAVAVGRRPGRRLPCPASAGTPENLTQPLRVVPPTRGLFQGPRGVPAGRANRPRGRGPHV